MTYPDSKMTDRLAAIDDYAVWLTCEKRNTAKATKIVGGAVAAGVLIVPAAFLAAPAIGGATGALTGLSGAAASSHGLAIDLVDLVRVEPGGLGEEPIDEVVTVDVAHAAPGDDLLREVRPEHHGGGHPGAELAALPQHSVEIDSLGPGLTGGTVVAVGDTGLARPSKTEAVAVGLCGAVHVLGVEDEHTAGSDQDVVRGST